MRLCHLLESLLLLVGKFVSNKWHTHDANILTTHLNVDIKVDLFFSWENVFYKLEKSLYSLMQPPRLWIEKLTHSLCYEALYLNIVV